MRRAIITGVTGQDGAYLAKFLLERGYEVFGTFRRLSTPNFWRLQSLGIHNKVKLISMDLSDMSSMFEALDISRPHEIYHLAAQSFVGASFDQPLATADMSGMATTKMLEAMRYAAKDARYYQASTSELYGNSNGKKNERTSFMPRSPYSAAKLYAYWITRIYRESYGLYATNGILFNHESPLRGLEFVTRKISNAAAKISLGLQKKLVLGNMEAARDWGYAPDFVKSMWMMLQEEEGDDYVIATGETHSVSEFVDLAFKRVGLQVESHVSTSKKLFRPLDIDTLCGDSSKAREKLKWKPETNFNRLVNLMVDADLEKWKSWMKGELFPWDAPLYPDDIEIIVSRAGLDQ